MVLEFLYRVFYFLAGTLNRNSNHLGWCSVAIGLGGGAHPPPAPLFFKCFCDIFFLNFLVILHLRVLLRVLHRVLLRVLHRVLLRVLHKDSDGVYESNPRAQVDGC